MKVLCLPLTLLVIASLAESKTYEVLQSGSRLSYSTWQARCASLGGRLASIQNANEQAAANAVLSGKSGSFLTGMKRKAPHHNTWVTVDHEVVKHKNWAPREPNDCCGGEQCLELYTGGHKGKWNDIRCSGKGAICEFSSTYFHLDGTGAKQSYAHWQAQCKNKGGYLARIENASQQKRAYKEIAKSRRHSVMIDSKRRRRGHRDFIYATGDLITYSNWNRGEPNNAGGHEECTEVYVRGGAGGKWNDISCSVAAALCEKSHTKRYVAYTVSSSKSRADLAAICAKKGGSLAYINTAAEQTAARAALSTVTNGAAVLTGMRRRWKGGYFINEFGFQVTYRNWNRGEPNNCCGGEDCLEIYTRGAVGKWNDIKCAGKAVLCQF